MNRRRLLEGLAAGLAIGLAGCARSAPAPGVARRVVSISPSTTEALFAIGAGGRVVGRSRYCDYPKEALALPSVGGYVDASLEAILALAPDLVVGARGPSGTALTDRLGARGIATYFPKAESMAEIDAMLEGLGDKVGMGAEARALVGRLRARRDAIASALAAAPRPRVLMVFGFSPIVVAGPGGFPDELLRLAGATNAVTSGTAYPAVGIEHLIALDPDVVVNAAMAEERAAARIGPDEPGWRELGAVRAGRVVLLTDEAVLRPGPRIADGLAILARAIHPEIAIP